MSCVGLQAHEISVHYSQRMGGKKAVPDCCAYQTNLQIVSVWVRPRLRGWETAALAVAVKGLSTSTLAPYTITYGTGQYKHSVDNLTGGASVALSLVCWPDFGRSSTESSVLFVVDFFQNGH